MKHDDPLLKIVACPLDKGPLHLVPDVDRKDEDMTKAGGNTPASHAGALYNPRLRRRYPITDGIPRLLPSSGEGVSDEEHERLLAQVSEGRPHEDRTGRPDSPKASS